MITPLGACIAQADIQFDRFEHIWRLDPVLLTPGSADSHPNRGLLHESDSLTKIGADSGHIFSIGNLLSDIALQNDSKTRKRDWND